MENDVIFEEIKKETLFKLISFKKAFLIYEVSVFFVCVIGGTIIALTRGSNSLIYDAATISAEFVLGANIVAPFALICIYILFIVFWLPAKIAKKRGHAYTNIIQILNLAGIFTIVTWFIAAAWALFPSEKSLIDPLVGNVTGLGRRNIGDSIGAVKHGMNRGIEAEKETDRQMDNLIDMRSKGLLSDEEFKQKKTALFQT